MMEKNLKNEDIKQKMPQIKPFKEINNGIKEELKHDIEFLFKRFSKDPDDAYPLPIISYLSYKIGMKPEDIKEIISKKDIQKAFKKLFENVEMVKEDKPNYVG